MPSYRIWTVGCQMNVADSLKLAAGLDRLGFVEAAEDADADLEVLNTCSVRQHAEDRAYGRLHQLRQDRSKGREFTLAVMGCMVGPRTTDLERRFPWVDVWSQPQVFDPILERAGLMRDASEGEFWTETFAVPNGVTAFVPVVHGCDKFCTYCIVPLRRGRERSRPVDEILREVRFLAERGVREVTLLGQTVEAYGHDLEGADAGADLATLFEGIEAIDGILRVRFLTSYPKDMTDRIIDAVASSSKVCEHFNIPVQSGDDAMLARMRRGYTLAEYEERVARIRQVMPDVALATDVIVGCPGETDEEFQHTVELLERTQFDVIHVAAYSPRPGTYAYRNLEDDVPREVKKARLQVIEALHAESSARINRASLGQEVEVLVEREDEHGRSTGRTRRGQLVHFDGTGLVGQLARVRIHEVTSWSLSGRLAGDLTLALV
ncbi:MAG: tRNA (N6-isopentenyl adenosine(37)-C2)-methylthiotransferase MiaB [Dehalococcoidia bacterium]